MQVYVGFCLTHILSSCHAWRYSQRRQRWQIAAAALQVLGSALAGPLAGPADSQPAALDWSLATAVAQAVSQSGGLAGYLLPNLPPHAGTAATTKLQPVCSATTPLVTSLPWHASSVLLT